MPSRSRPSGRSRRSAERRDRAHAQPSDPGSATTPDPRARGAAVAVAEAGGGFGNTTLALELADELGIAGVVVELTAGDVDGRALLSRSRVALRWAGLSDLAQAVEDPTTDPDALVDDLSRALAAELEPVLLVIDDAHHLRAPDASSVLVRLAEVVGPPHRLVVLTRQVRDPLAVVVSRPGTVRLGARDLTFTDAEVAALAGGVAGSAASEAATPAVVQAILRASAGSSPSWPTCCVSHPPVMTRTARSRPPPIRGSAAGSRRRGRPDRPHAPGHSLRGR